PPEVKRVVLLADHDTTGTGPAAAERAARRHHSAGRQVWIAMPSRVGDDFNDMLLADGPEAVRACIEAAEEWLSEPKTDDINSSSGEHRPVGFPAPHQLPVLRADNGNLADLTDACWRVLHDANTPPWLFRCGARLSWVERDDDGHPMPVALTEDRVRHILARLVTWLKKAKTGDLVPAYPPAGALKDVLATPDPNVPVLAGVVAVPVFGGDGKLITTPGYHPSSRLLYEPPTGFTLPPVPASPSSAEIAAARSLLLDDLLGDFPFTGEAERAHALALLLLPFVRPMISGPTPLHLIEKPSPGTGASLMVEAIAQITTAAPASIMVESREEEEWRKRLTAKLRQAPTLLLIDNLTRRLDSASVAAAITSTNWEDRILGRSETARLPVRCAWIATGNNPQVSNEIARRSVRIRLDARVDQPWRRDGFRHANLTTWVSGRRSHLIVACLTLVQAWIRAGRPHHARSIGGFESWAATLGGILDVAGVPGFLGNLEEMYEAADAEGGIWRTFVSAWWERFGAQGVGIADLYAIALDCEPPLSLGDGSERSQRTRLGRALARMRDRMFAIPGQQVRLMLAGERNHSQLWTLASIAAAPSSVRTPSGSETGLRDFRDFSPTSTDTENSSARDFRDVIRGLPTTGLLEKSLTRPVENSEENCGPTGLRDFRDFSSFHTRTPAYARTYARVEEPIRSPESPSPPATPQNGSDFLTGETRDDVPSPPTSPVGPRNASDSHWEDLI
ncbi:MAG: toprim domain-containing protein, partial [Alphaproteobacteria bacterium]|nr:toprim domain-containing protein [Alphaproteobacteria bacterium]